MIKKLKLKSRFLLALFPIVIVMIVLGIELLMRQHILFTSLMSSIFLIYIKPEDPMNRSFTIIVSQGLAAIIGYASFLLLGTSYWAACTTVIVVTFSLVLIGRLHPPAIATSLIFNYRTHSETDLVLFGLLIGIIILLLLTKQGYTYFKKKLFED